MASFRYVHFVIDTHLVSTATTTEVLAERLKLLVSNLLSILRDAPNENGEVIPIKWMYNLFDSRIAQVAAPLSSQTSTMSFLSADSLSSFSLALTESLSASMLVSQSSSSSSSTYTTSSISPVRTKSQNRHSQEINASPSPFASYLENIGYAVSHACRESAEWAAMLDERDRDGINTSQQNRVQARLKRSESLMFLLSPCPQTTLELMRSVERPEDMIKLIANPLFDETAAFAYARPKIKQALDVFVDTSHANHSQDANRRFTWISTREWVFEESPTSSATNDYFGEWDRFSESVTGSKGYLQISETLNQSKIGVFHASSFSAVLQLVWPSKMMDHLYIHPFQPKKPRLTSIWLHCGESKIRLVLESFSGPSTTSCAAHSLNHLFKVPSKEVYKWSWSGSWMATSPGGHKWNSLLCNLISTSTSLVCSDTNAETIYVVNPIGLDATHIVQLDWEKNIVSKLKMASIPDEPGVESLSSSQPHNSHIVRKLLRRMFYQISSSMPVKSIGDVSSVFSQSGPPEADGAVSPSSKKELIPDTNSATTHSALMFADDPMEVQFSDEFLSPSRIVSPPTSRARSSSINSSSMDIESIKSPKDALKREAALLDKEQINEALQIHLADLYSIFWRGTPLALQDITFPGQKSNYTAIQGVFQHFPIPSSFSSPTITQPSPASSSSIEYGLLQQLSQLVDVALHDEWTTRICHLLETTIILNTMTLRMKYMNASSDVNESYQDAEALPKPKSKVVVPSSHVTNWAPFGPAHTNHWAMESKLTEYRMQVIFAIVEWRLLNHMPVSTLPSSDVNVSRISFEGQEELETSIRPKKSRKIEMPEKTRKSVLSLIEAVGFMLSASSDMQAFTTYLKELESVCMQDIPNTVRWMTKRLGLDKSIDTSSDIVLDMSMSRSSNSKSPKRSNSKGDTTVMTLPSLFLVNLIESTSSILLDTKNAAPAKSPAAALSMLVASSASIMRPRDEDVELSPRKQPSKRSAEGPLDSTSAKRKLQSSEQQE